jgi:MFS family permease
MTESTVGEARPINRPAITACVILAVIMQALDTTIANVALPYMQGSVSASADQINWVLTSYIVAAAIMTPPSGFLANKFGRRRVLLAAVTGFVIASVLCGIAQSLVQIVAFRLLQGFSARRGNSVIAHAWSPWTASGRAALDQVIQNQASIISYIDDFKLMMILSLGAIPLVLLLRRAASPASSDHAMVTE